MNAHTQANIYRLYDDDNARGHSMTPAQAQVVLDYYGIELIDADDDTERLRKYNPALHDAFEALIALASKETL